MDEQPCALEVGEELMAEPRTVGSALDEPRDVGDGELASSGPSTTPSTGSSVVNG